MTTDHLVSITVAGEAYFVYVPPNFFYGMMVWMWLHHAVNNGELASA